VLAADTAGEHLLESLESGASPKSAMYEAIMAAAARVEQLAHEGPPEPSRNSPACTIVSAVASEGEVTIGWVGDSRAYWFPDRRSGSERLTLDDSWAARMVEAQLMTEAEAYADPRAHAITGWLGADAVEVEPHTVVFTPDAPGVILVCTDGLWNYEESAAALAAVVPADARTRPLEAARELVRFACARGGHDNITVAVLPCLPAAPASPAAPSSLAAPDSAPTVPLGQIQPLGQNQPLAQNQES
jgi:serine/threonine protein phosphatase PrpC